MKNRIFRSNNKKGYTLAEVLVTIAIIAILGAVVAISASQMIKNTRQKSLDKMAETIFLVAERNIQKAYWVDGVTLAASGTVTDSSAASEKEMILPADTVSDEVSSSKWYISYQTENDNCHVKTVYCTTSDNDYAKTFTYNEGELSSVWSSKEGKVGYYNGGPMDSLPYVQGQKFDKMYAALKVENDEELGVGVYIKLPDFTENPAYYNGSHLNPKNVKYKLSITGLTSGAVVELAEKELSALSGKFKYQNVDKNHLMEGSNCSIFTDYVVLDNLKSVNTQFKTIAAGITPGEEILVEISASCVGAEAALDGGIATALPSEGSANDVFVSNGWSGSVQTNSLFAKREIIDANSDRVEVAYGRHLQNLDTLISGMPEGKKLSVVQTRTIDFKTSDTTYNEGRYNEQWAKIYTGYTWTPIRNVRVDSYDGGVLLASDGTISATSTVQGIKNLTVTYSDTRVKSSNATAEANRKLYAGIFGDYSGSKIQNIACENFVIDYYRNNYVEEKSTAAACIIGRAKKNIEIKNCRVDKAEITVGQSFSGASDKTMLGGIVAHIWAGANVQNCYVDKSILIGYEQCCYVSGIVGFSCSGNYSPDIPVRDASNLYINNCKCSQTVLGGYRDSLLSAGICTYTFNNLVDIEDCTVEGVSITTYAFSNSVSIIGGIIARPDSENTIIKNCKVYNTADNIAAYAASNIGSTGGVYNKSHLTKARNYVNSTVTASSANYDARNLTWFYSYGGSSSGENNIYAISTVGGITGYVMGASGTVIEDCYAATTIATNNNYGINGGISGNGLRDYKLNAKNCYADCYISGQYISGIASNCNEASTFTNCYAAGFLRCDNAVKAAGICTNKATVTGCYSLMNYDNIWDSSKFTTANLTFSDGYVSAYPSDAKPANSNTSLKGYIYRIAGDNSSVDENTYYTYGGDGDWIKDQSAQTSNKSQYASLRELVDKFGEQTDIIPYRFAPACISDNLATAKLPKMLTATGTFTGGPHYGDWLERPGNRLYARVYKTSDNKYVMFF